MLFFFEGYFSWGPFSKPLLNLLQYCFCCLCSDFLARRHVGSLLHDLGLSQHPLPSGLLGKSQMLFFDASVTPDPNTIPSRSYLWLCRWFRIYLSYFFKIIIRIKASNLTSLMGSSLTTTLNAFPNTSLGNIHLEQKAQTFQIWLKLQWTWGVTISGLSGVHLLNLWGDVDNTARTNVTTDWERNLWSLKCLGPEGHLGKTSPTTN